MIPKIGDIFRNYFCGSEFKVIGVKGYNSYADTWTIDYVGYDLKGCEVCEKDKTKVLSTVRTTKE